MKSALARAVTVFLTATAVTLTGVGVASAGGPGGSGSSSTTSAAAQVQSLRDQLVSRADNGDVAGTRVTLTDLDPVLTDLARASGTPSRPRPATRRRRPSTTPPKHAKASTGWRRT